MKFTEHMNRLIASRAQLEPRAAIFDYNDKLAGRILADELNVALPRLINPPMELQSPGWTYGPLSSVVLKPVNGYGGRGVLPLKREVTGFFRCLFDDVRRPDRTRDAHPWHTWIHEAEMIQRGFKGTEHEIGPRWIAEELIESPIPHWIEAGVELATVWKVYCIHGEPIWARQLVSSSRRGGFVECWDLELEIKQPTGERVLSHIPAGVEVAFRRIGRDVFTNHPLQKHAKLPNPTTPAIFGYAYAIAQELQKRTGTPFVRVDLLEGPGGQAYFGEITPHPSGGNDVYLEEWDVRLGKIWSAGGAS